MKKQKPKAKPGPAKTGSAKTGSSKTGSVKTGSSKPTATKTAKAVKAQPPAKAAAKPAAKAKGAVKGAKAPGKADPKVAAKSVKAPLVKASPKSSDKPGKAPAAKQASKADGKPVVAKTADAKPAAKAEKVAKLENKLENKSEAKPSAKVVAPKVPQAKAEPKPIVIEEPDQAEDVVLTDADGRRYCRVKDCDRLAEVDAYCRYHYILLWKNIQTRRHILQEGKLERYIEELTARYPDKFLEILKKDLRSEKDFLAAIQELEIDESAVEAEFDDEESQSDLFEIQRVSDSGGGGARSEEDDRF